MISPKSTFFPLCVTYTSTMQSGKSPTTVCPLDPVYHRASIHLFLKNRDARARGNEGDRLRRPADRLGAEHHADTDGDVHPPSSLPRAQGQATVSVMPILTLEENALTLRFSTFLEAMGLTRIRVGQSLEVRGITRFFASL